MDNNYCDMELIKDTSFSGERPLFASHDLHLDNVTILEGESAIKKCSNIIATNCRFEGNYPFWHVHGFTIDKCYFAVGGRGTYPFMFSEGIYVDGLESDSKYVFQYVRNAEIHNAKITTKDAFWEVENVTIYDSELNGEYLGWHSRNLRLVNCHISGEQPLCHARDLVLENCTFDPSCDRAFEYSTLRADIRGSITNIKNPTSGHIVADSIGSVTIDANIELPADCVIEQRK